MTEIGKDVFLGKKPATHDHRDLRLSNYLTVPSHKLVVPSSFGWGWEIGDNDWGMNGNGPDDTVEPGFGGAGDCVFAGGGHEHEMVNKIAGRPAPVITGKESIADYSAVTGYVVGDDSTDQGTDMREAAKYRQNTGLLDADGNRHKISAYLALDPGNEEELYAALLVFGFVGVGIEFPSSAMTEFDNGEPWKVVRGAQIEGGHYIPIVARRHEGLHLVTWGRNTYMTVGFYRQYTDEALVYITPELLTSAGTTRKAMGLLNLDQLNADLQELGKGTL